MDVIRYDYRDGTLVVGARRWPCRAVAVTDTRLPIGLTEFHCMRDRAFRVMFESGWSVSIIWGSATYSSNHLEWNEGSPFREGVRFTDEPHHVECAVILPKVKHTLLEGAEDMVLSYVDAVELNELLDGVSRLGTTDFAVLEQFITGRAADLADEPITERDP